MNFPKLSRLTRTPFAICSALFLSVTGCDVFDEDQNQSFSEFDSVPPTAPSGVVSVTGDGEVRLDWDDNTEPDLAEYRVYWAETNRGPYDLVGATRVSTFIDRDVDNGVTYYYAVTAVDEFGNESELSNDTVHDTPRPEGTNLVLWSFVGDQPELSGFDFSERARRPFDSAEVDVYYGVEGGRYAMIAFDGETDLQDAGYVTLDALNWAPPRGWTAEDRVTLIEGHSYYVWTRNDHFAKFRVVSMSIDRVVIDWAYQIDKANPELVAPRGGGTDA